PREPLVCLLMSLGPDRQERPHPGIHRGLPELFGIHFAQAFVPVDRNALLPRGDEVVDQFVERTQSPLGRLVLSGLARHPILRVWSPRSFRSRLRRRRFWT